MFDELDQLLASDAFAKGKAKSTLKLKEGERREVCILFADVKGFTTLSERLDHEDVHAILDKLMQLFTARIKHYGGYVDKYEGDLVMALFGAKIASERDTERAIHAALQMREILEQFNILLGKRLGKGNRLDVRIGINIGWTTTGKVGEKREGDFTVYGDAVNIASRMETNAPINRIMLPEEIMRIVEDTFDFEDHGKIKVKGKSEPISVFLVKGLKPERLHRWQMRRSKYVGRDKELVFLDEKYESVKKRLSDPEFQEYKPMLIGIKGEAGMGKSRLVDEFLKSKPELPFYLHGSAPRVAPQPFCIFTSLIRKHLGISQIDKKEIISTKLETGFKELAKSLYDKEEKENLSSQLPILGHLLGVKYDDIRLQLEPKELRPHIHTAIRYFIEALAAKANRQNAPLIIVFEDLQWLDEASAEVLLFLMFTLNLEEKRKKKNYKHITILLAYRPEWKGHKRLKTNADFHEMNLEPIDQTSGKELIQSMAEELEISENTFNTVMDKSEGNPFYIEEWVNLIIDSPELERKEALPVPNTLHTLVLSRIDRLEQDVKLLLQKAAVLGREFFVKTLEEMEKKLERFEDISSRLDQLESNDFVLPSPGAKISAYLFKHIITQEVAYNTLLIANRKILHRIAAEVIEEHFKEDLTSHYADLAEHYNKASVSNKAVEYLMKAADHARENYQNQASIHLYDKLLSLLSSQPEEEVIGMKIDALNRKGNVLLFVGNIKQAEEDIILAHELTEKLLDKEKIRDSLHLLAWLNSIKGNYTAAMQYYKEQLKICEDLGDKKRISGSIEQIGQVYCALCNYDEAMEHYNKSLKINEELKDNERISGTALAMGTVYYYQGNYPNAKFWFEKSLRISEELGDKLRIAKATTNLGNVYTSQGDRKMAMECYIKGLNIFEELNYKPDMGIPLGQMGHIYELQGDNVRALECYEKQLNISQELGDKLWISRAVGNMGTVYQNQGNLSKAMECFEKWLKIAQELGDKRGISFAEANLGFVFWRQGDFNQAIEYYWKSISIAGELGNKQGSSWFLGNMGLVFADKGDYDRALECFQKSLSITEEMDYKQGISVAMVNMGNVFFETGDYEQADEYFVNAVKIGREIGYKPNLTIFLIDKIKLSLSQNLLTKAQEECHEALTLARELKNDDLIKQAEILSHKVEFAAGDDAIRSVAAEALEALLGKTDNSEHHAEINYELWQMHNMLNDPGKADNHRREAIRLYNELYSNKPKFVFKKRIEDLESGK